MKNKFITGFFLFSTFNFASTAHITNHSKFPKIVRNQLEQQTEFDNHYSVNQQIKFLSYNIQLSGLDNENHLWKDRKYAVSKLLSCADAFAVQEITHEQLLDLQNMLVNYTIVGFNTVTGDNLENNASNIQEGLVIGFIKDAFALKSTDMLWYSDTPVVPSQTWGAWKSAFPKALQRATLIFLANNKEIAIFNSHFAHDEDPTGIINPRLLSSQLELSLLQQINGYWISAGDRNFHYPRDLNAYAIYDAAVYVCDSRKNTQTAGSITTFMGYEDHPRVNPITADGDFEKAYYLDVIFHNPNMMKSNLWVSHIGEYSTDLQLLPLGSCKQPHKRLFASDHSAIFVVYQLNNFWK